jgi:signal transduction histidine kinase
VFPERLLERRSVKYGVLFTLALVAGLLETAQSYLRAQLQQRTFSWQIGLLDALPSWLLLAVLVPVVVAVARRVRLDRSPVGRALVLHVAAAFAFALVHQTMMALWIQWRFADVRFAMYLTKMATAYLAIDIVVYWGVVGGYYAFDYARELRRRELSASQLWASLTEARLEALRAQVNPHFLFNTLNAISVLAMKGENSRVTQTLALLSDLLRLTLDGGLPQQVPLSRELELTDLYLEIQCVRFPDRLKVDRDIAPEALDALVPSLLLQPIVENAIVHGIAQNPAGGEIVVRAFRDGGDLRLQVCDTGPGFSAGAVRPGIGLTNTRARLEQLYGVHQRMSWSNRSPGACVDIAMPFRSSIEGKVA